MLRAVDTSAGFGCGGVAPRVSVDPPGSGSVRREVCMAETAIRDKPVQIHVRFALIRALCVFMVSA